MISLFRDCGICEAPSLNQRPSTDVLRPGSSGEGVKKHPLVAQYWATQTPHPAKLMIRNALLQAGRDPSRLSPDDANLLSGVDEFHCLGQQATLALAKLANIDRGAYVLDVGSGIGGPSRRLALEFGCRVVGLDITKEYVEAAQGLAEGMGLSSRDVSYRHGDAVDLPFKSRTFDIVWLQVATTNIAARDRLYSEICRVLKPGGRAAMFDIFSGPGGPVHFPVPWGNDESTSALLSAAETESALAAAGLRLLSRQDASNQAMQWFQEQVRLFHLPEGPPLLGFHILLPGWERMAFNQLRNLRERRIFFNYLIIERP